MRDEHDKSRLSFWFPLIEPYFKVPTTRIIRLGSDNDLVNIADGEHSKSFGPLCDQIDQAARLIGYPVFLRTDYTSAKHSWKRSCFVPDAKHIQSAVHAITEFSACADILGLPVDTWAVRQMIPTTPMFHAFDEMPIVREFRFFIRDGIVEHFQPYWPPYSIHRASDADWLAKLHAGNQITVKENRELEAATRLVGSLIDGGFGHWSIDWLQDASGEWWLTDMALGDQSYKWEPSDLALQRPAYPDISL